VPDLHRLTLAALRAVADGNRPRELVLDAYLLRAMGIAGWAPALIECARCATPGPHRAFHVAAGGSVCVHCRPSGSATPPQGVMDLMAALHDGDWEAAEASSPSQRAGGCAPAVAPRTADADVAAGRTGLSDRYHGR
jgi:DNA repair protein RecO (recombination protein O)